MESPRARRARRAQDSRAGSASSVDARAVIRRRSASASRKEEGNGVGTAGGARRPPRVVAPEPEAAETPAAAAAAAALDESTAATYVYRDAKGIFSACTILCLWAAAFYFSHFCVRLAPTPAPVGGGSSSSSTGPAPPLLPASPLWVSFSAFAVLTQMYMGLFVTAHDAMHGAVCRKRRWLNDLIGAVCICCYAFFSYEKLHEEHWRHHHWTGRTRMAAEVAAAGEEARQQQRGEKGERKGGGGGRGSGSAARNGAPKKQQQQEQHGVGDITDTSRDPPLLRYDPDYHSGDPSLLPWFAAFMRHYSSPGQYARIGAATLALLAVGAPYANLCLYMCGAAVLAAFQLFYWGTYRPHRPDAAARRAHARGRDPSAAEMPWRRARSAPWPNFVLFFQAYFFNLHYHHHRWPYCPWWDLPRLRREARTAGAVPGFGGEVGEEAY